MVASFLSYNEFGGFMYPLVGGGQLPRYAGLCVRLVLGCTLSQEFCHGARTVCYSHPSRCHYFFSLLLLWHLSWLQLDHLSDLSQSDTLSV